MIKAVEERRKQIIEQNGGASNPDAKLIGNQADAEYADFIKTAERINKKSGKQMVNIDGLKAKMGSVTVEQYVALIQQMNSVAKKLNA